MGNKAIAVTTYHISNPDEWLVLREEVKPDNTNRRETNVLVETENWVDEYIDKHGKSPTYLQVADHFKIGRTASYAPFTPLSSQNEN